MSKPDAGDTKTLSESMLDYMKDPTRKHMEGMHTWPLFSSHKMPVADKKAKEREVMEQSRRLRLLRKKNARRARERLKWEFTIPDIRALHLEEVADTLTRENPVAYIQQEDWNKEAYVIIHRSLYTKGRVLDGEYSPDNHDFKGMLGRHMYAVVPKAKGMSVILKWAKAVQKADWPDTERDVIANKRDQLIAQKRNTSKVTLKVSYPEV